MFELAVFELELVPMKISSGHHTLAQPLQRSARLRRGLDWAPRCTARVAAPFLTFRFLTGVGTSVSASSIHTAT